MLAARLGLCHSHSLASWMRRAVARGPAVPVALRGWVKWRKSGLWHGWERRARALVAHSTSSGAARGGRHGRASQSRSAAQTYRLTLSCSAGEISTDMCSIKHVHVTEQALSVPLYTLYTPARIASCASRTKRCSVVTLDDATSTVRRYRGLASGAVLPFWFMAYGGTLGWLVVGAAPRRYAYAYAVRYRTECHICEFVIRHINSESRVAGYSHTDTPTRERDHGAKTRRARGDSDPTLDPTLSVPSSVQRSHVTHDRSVTILSHGVPLQDSLAAATVRDHQSE